MNPPVSLSSDATELHKLLNIHVTSMLKSYTFKQLTSDEHLQKILEEDSKRCALIAEKLHTLLSSSISPSIFGGD
ncbi:hypothetical protein PASE110613_05885 [Paenibacillus sediminis]|uniref:Spore coat protein n=1 Tax=Paenibacillus sediminis TaxID=664909 RepID=A0ABS4H1B2_9BACL|nr:hypothetical protein [Paenibacillus sediminis]MBP1936309.1 hypothetical protein [Paenibacillus sediminis]